MVHPQKMFGDTTRAKFRKDNYWMRDAEKQDQPPWYIWDSSKLPISRSNIEESSERVNVARCPGCNQNFRKDLREYLLTSTLHGLRYIGEKKLTWFERFFWLAAFVLSVICAGFFILNVYAKWRMTPMIVSVNPENMPLSRLPFPALTICNVNQAKKTVAERIKRTGPPYLPFQWPAECQGLVAPRSNSTLFVGTMAKTVLIGAAVDKKLLESLCSNLSDDAIFENEVADNADWDHTRTFLINVTQPCNDMILRCIWNSKIMDCLDLFNAHLTDEGLCCIFNVVHREKMFRNPRDLNDLNLTFPSPAVDWTPESGYPDDAPDDGFPWRPKGVGSYRGLTLVLDANVDEYYCASTESPGFKILLHNPIETPKIAHLGEVIAPGLESRVAVEPKIFDSQTNLRTIDVSKRLCVFSSEKDLTFYRTYTLKNCEMECESRIMLSICDCVLYYMPKNKTSRVCGKADAKCYLNIKKLTLQSNTNVCDECLPACTEISYTQSMTSAPISKTLVADLAEELNKTPEYFIENMLIAHFYFEDGSFIRYTKGEIFGLTEFLSNTGGLLGLCMGFSMMSAVELIYYMTLRAFCSPRRNQPKLVFKP